MFWQCLQTKVDWIWLQCPSVGQTGEEMLQVCTCMFLPHSSVFYESNPSPCSDGATSSSQMHQYSGVSRSAPYLLATLKLAVLQSLWLVNTPGFVTSDFARSEWKRIGPGGGGGQRAAGGTSRSERIRGEAALGSDYGKRCKSDYRCVQLESVSVSSVSMFVKLPPSLFSLDRPIVRLF